MSRRKTRAKELARRWRKKKHARQKLAAVRNKAEQAERVIRSMDRPERSQILTGHPLDQLASEYRLCRTPGEPDASFRARIQDVMLGPRT
jgi:hypothetical protein